MSWAGIVNTATRVITVAKKDVNAIVGIAGKDANAAIKLFIKCEPVAVTVLTPLCPQAVIVLRAAYAIAEKVEGDISAPGATKLNMATGILADAVLPGIEEGLSLGGMTIDTAQVNAVADALFSAIVAENNAQSHVTALLTAAAQAKTLPDPAELAAAEAAVATAVASVKTLGLAINSAISSVQKAV